jgi:RimJ/RimL family protein N-acetyltransferase
VIELLRAPKLELAIAHLARSWGEPDDAKSRPYSSDVPFDAAGREERYQIGWQTQLDEPGWIRTWGLVIDGEVRGHCDLKGGQLASDLHRATVGIGIERAHCDRGNGRRLMDAAIAWARRGSVVWLDLGVFSTNARAIALYRKLGFVEVGVTRDRFRIDGRSIDDIAMTLAL